MTFEPKHNGRCRGLSSNSDSRPGTSWKISDVLPSRCYGCFSPTHLPRFASQPASSGKYLTSFHLSPPRSAPPSPRSTFWSHCGGESLSVHSGTCSQTATERKASNGIVIERERERDKKRRRKWEWVNEQEREVWGTGASSVQQAPGTDLFPPIKDNLLWSNIWKVLQEKHICCDAAQHSGKIYFAVFQTKTQQVKGNITGGGASVWNKGLWEAGYTYRMCLAARGNIARPQTDWEQYALGTEVTFSVLKNPPQKKETKCSRKLKSPSRKWQHFSSTVGRRPRRNAERVLSEKQKVRYKETTLN